jgi:hypothetical protein
MRVLVPRATFAETVAEWLPVTVAAGKSVPAGAAGRATFEIKRGEPAIEVTPRGVSAEAKLTGEIRLCKPFGPVCVEYGRCRPEWTARLHVNTPWAIKNVPDVELDVDVTRGCILSPVKFDATRELEKITREEVVKIRKRIGSEVRKHHASLGESIEDISNQLRLTGLDTTSVNVESIALGLTQNDAQYVASVEARGELSARDGSGAPSETSSPSSSNLHRAHPLLSPDARVTTDANLDPTTHVQLETPIVLSVLVRDWQTRLSSQHVRATATGNQVLVEVTPWKTCASAWVLFQPEFTSNTIQLTPVGASDPELVAALPLPQVLTQHAEVQTAALREFEKQWREPVTFESKHSRAPLRMTLEPTLTLEQNVRVESDTLVLTGVIHGAITGTVAPNH